MNISLSELRKNASIKGVILGIALTVLSVFSYYFIVSIAASFWTISFGPFLFSAVIPIAIASVFCTDLRKKAGGFWTFKQAATGIFVMFLVSYAVKFVTYDLLFTKVIEPNSVEKVRTVMMDATTKMLEKSGADQDKIDEQMAKMEKGFKDQEEKSAVSVITGIAISLIFIFVIALIFAAIFKKYPPPVQISDATV
ncbi:DUF4199 domain-containing protein [Mucilaginibacter sp. RS28]|uniref:DUF4199 domain-containing protein n=1 Tax=Mucilaginibacter straminoryzae TaxID=2932774 RepID=A0A9X2BE94_9SPHI|nr:DUF4199 domain-containing protein [Mucilaginibacter straminoryzae]MCJ8211173.1 DUF4199 domain-containing protein [Mucilaginibacter straminoryzae]